jgi:hypothetical protein
LGTLLTAMACGTPSQGSGGDRGDEISSSVTPRPTGLPSAMRPNQVQPDSRAVDLRPVRWNRVDPAGRQLTVHFTTTGRGGCRVLGRVDLVETAQTVTVTLLVGRLPNADCGGAQPQLAAPTTTVVTLGQPLGRRPVRDGAAAA